MELLSAPLERLLPKAWRPYAGLVAEGLEAFLTALPEARLEAAVGEQLALPESTRDERRAALLLRRFATLHKLAQVVARDRRLPARLRRQLQRLESERAGSPRGALRRLVAERLGRDAGDLRLSPGRAEAGSVAVVVPFRGRWRGAPVDGVLKLLKPGIEARLEEELAAWGVAAEALEARAPEYGLAPAALGETLAEVAALLRHEVRLDLEQRHLDEAATLYRRVPGLHVPARLPWCTGQVTAMERLAGVKVNAARVDSAEARRLAQRAADGLLAVPFWSAVEAALFHGDPHGGNLLRTAEGRVGVIDWSLACRLSKARREACVDAGVAALTGSERRLAAALGRLGVAVRDDEPALGEAIAEVRAGGMPGLGWLVGLMDRLALAGYRSGGELVVLRKAVHALGGVLEDLAPGGSVDAVLLEAGIRQGLAEWPLRAWLAPADRSRLGSHIATAELPALSALLPRLWGEGLAG